MDLEQSLREVMGRIAAASERSGRSPADVQVVAVSKGHPPESVRALALAGHRLFGENKVQEGKAKMAQCPGRLRWHMIGHLQTNKCRDAVHFFEMIQSVDSLHVAREIDRWSERGAKAMPVLLEVNVSGESAKFGYAPERLLVELPEINGLRHLEVHGLMAMAPWTTDPEKVRPVFRRLRELKQRCEEILGAPLPHLSMGMSGDYEVAIEEGATIVRIGTALFGERPAARGSAAG